jgi:hypothetical protein
LTSGCFFNHSANGFIVALLPSHEHEKCQLTRLDKIPANARIPIVAEGRISPKKEVRDSFDRLRPLEKLKVEKRGWTLLS